MIPATRRPILLSFVAMVLAAFAVGCTMDASPNTAVNEVGTQHTIDISISTVDPIISWEIEVTVLSGPNAGASGTFDPGSSGGDSATVSWTYTSNGNEGDDSIQVCVAFYVLTNFLHENCDTVGKRWIEFTPTPESSETVTLTPSATNTPRTGFTDFEDLVRQSFTATPTATATSTPLPTATLAPTATPSFTVSSGGGGGLSPAQRAQVQVQQQPVQQPQAVAGASTIRPPATGDAGLK